MSNGKSGKMLQKLLISVGILAVLLYFIPKAIRLATDLVLGTVEQKMCENSVRYTIEQLSQMGRGYIFLPPVIADETYNYQKAREDIPENVYKWAPGFLDNSHPLPIMKKEPFEINNNQLIISSATILQYLYNRFPETCSGRFGDGDGVDLTDLVSHSRLKEKSLRMFITTFKEIPKESEIEEVTNLTCPERPLRIRPPSGKTRFRNVKLPANALADSDLGFEIKVQLDYVSVEGSDGTCSGSTKQRYDYDLFNSAAQPKIVFQRKLPGKRAQWRFQFLNLEPGSAIICGSGNERNSLKWQPCPSLAKVNSFVYQGTNNSGLLDILYSGGESYFGVTTVDIAGNVSQPLIVGTGPQ